MAICSGASLFGSTSQYIKVGNGEFIAIEGSTTRDRLLVSDLRMPYKQLLKSRVILKPGQVNYLLNHLGLGDNATFLAIKAVYNQKSVIEEDNFVNWSFYDDLTKVYSFAQMMVLTGNSSNRVKQLYLTNPNTNYEVTLDVMIGVIDDSYNFFNDSINQTATSFTGLEYTDIKSYVVSESIVINDKSSPARPLIYISLVNIESIQRSEKILILDDSSLGTIFLQFLTESDASQAHSLLNYLLENPNINIDNISPIADLVDPVIYFNERAGATGSFISFNGSTASVPYNTGDGFTFSTSISLLDFGTSSGTLLDKTHLLYLLIDYIEDNRDGLMSMLPNNLIISGTAGDIPSITGVGTYSLTFDFSDIAQNYLDGVVLALNVTP
jgi:hypothetical protein